MSLCSFQKKKKCRYIIKMNQTVIEILIKILKRRKKKFTMCLFFEIPKITKNNVKKI